MYPAMHTGGVAGGGRPRARVRATELLLGPGPNCPMVYTVAPEPEHRDRCLKALAKLRSAPQTASTVSAIAAAEQWLAKWYKEHDRLTWYYKTHQNLKDPSYAPAFAAIHRDTSDLLFLRGPNQVGKSYVGVAHCFYYARAKHPWRKISSKWADPTVAKTILIVTGSDKNREGVFQALWNLCPVDDIDWVSTHYDSRNGWGVRNPVIFFPRTNVKIIFRSSNQDTDSLNSLTADGIWIDEPPKAGTIDEIRRAGVARGAWVLITCTPVGELGEDFTWLKHYVEGDPDTGTAPRGNWSLHSVTIPDCPWFSVEELEKRKDIYSEEQTPQRLFGEWESAPVARSFTHFKESGPESRLLLRWAPELYPKPQNLRYCLCLDHGEKAETQAIVLLAWDETDPEGWIVVLGEWISRAKTTALDDAAGALGLIMECGICPEQLVFIVGDINSGGKEAQGEPQNKLFYNAFADLCKGRLTAALLKPNKYSKSVEIEERRVNTAFKLLRLYVHARCKNALRSFRYYRSSNSVVDKKYKHVLDAVRYGLQIVLDRCRVAVLQSKYRGRVKRLQGTFDDFSSGAEFG